MIRSLYTSGWGMLARTKEMDVISNNLANVNTTGFKTDKAIMESFPDMLTRRINDPHGQNPRGEIGNMQLGSDVSQIHTHYKQGQLLTTENRFDFGIDKADAAFFTIGVINENGDLDEYYSRDGSFTRNINNELITKSGDLVMGENGPIILDGENFVVSENGTITLDGEVIDRLKMAQFEDTSILRKLGNNLITALNTEGIQEFTGEVRQGHLEQSNVNTIREMVDMISVMRSYEANQKVVSAVDETLGKAVNEVGIVR